MEAHNPQRWEAFTHQEIAFMAIALTSYLVDHVADNDVEGYDLNLVMNICKMVSEMNVNLGSPPLDPRVFMKLEELKEE